ncbi:MAG: bifunctional (p)ppGpp synthetase/guanosine-3',5'-bis(diphosphate) 3'-pyrophosphohydrolase [Rhodobacterales bacterium]|nr:bifunctional (p)ppGpp synthetase/guanosine-3',5'-bis(diphosphate) 3'-pyrophosphohydrolase [Rhodobacterales bacterium]
MLTAEALAELVSDYNPKSNSVKIIEAYRYGQIKHEGQFRKSGEPYFTHPVSVAEILAEQRLDDATIITALLHDTIEDTGSTKQEIAKLFSHEISELVDGVTKLTKIQLSSMETQEAENIRKLLMAIAQDIRVILVKLADRLHNMRTIKSMARQKQQQKARETMDIFAPLAGRMGMQFMREDLEDLAFKVLNPKGRESIIRRFITLQKDSGDVIERISGDMLAEFKKENIQAKVLGRAKKPYSMWRKMQEKELSFSRLSDIYGFRIICATEVDCYRILGVIHRRWKAVPGRFKDYISQPKSNGYRSIHTAVSAESGVAAHWSYRDGVRSENPFTVDPVQWITRLIDEFDSEEDHEVFLEAVKLEMYADKVFCFSPKGDVLTFPRGATPIDFAYAIHTRIGNSCVGAKVDGLRVPLWTKLRNGQSVEIITAQGQNPQPTWLDMTETGKAKTAIRRALREVDKERMVVMGKALLQTAFEHIGKRATDKSLELAASKMRLSDSKELLARVGSTEVRPGHVVRLVHPEVTSADDFDVDQASAVIGLHEGQFLDRRPCCGPLPGERIVGIASGGSGVAIHAIDCPALVRFEDKPELWIDLHWHAGKHAAVYPSSIEVDYLTPRKRFLGVFGLAYSQLLPHFTVCILLLQQ